MNFFAELPAQAKAIIGGLALLAFIALGANFLPRGGGNAGEGGNAAPPGETLIFRNMEPHHAGEAAAELKEKQIPFKIVRDGTAISVPNDRADEARIKLALKGLPKEGDVGFSQLFGDKPNSFISTDFEKKVALTRALNGELARLIRKIDGIDGASVLINEPEDQLFAEDKKPVTASVMVKVAPNRTVAKAQVEGIQHLVASAVPGLKTTNVTVVSDGGKLLSDGLADNAGNQEDRLLAKVLDRQLSLTREREVAVETKVQSLLDKIFGAGKAVVRVAVELDFTQKKTKTDLYAPPIDQRGVTAPTNSQRTEERGGTGAAGGAPGYGVNAPGVPTYPFAGNQSSGGYNRTSETVVNNQYSRNTTLTEDQVGTIKRMSLTALIQGLPPERVAAMTQIVIAAAGADVAGRGDQVVVQPAAFDTSQTDMLKQLLDQENAAKAAEAAKKKKEGGIPLSWIIGTGVAFLILVVLLALMRMGREKEDTTEVLVNTLGDPGLPPQFDPNALAGFNNEMMGTVPMADPYGNPGAYGASGSQYQEGPFSFLEHSDPETVAELLSQERPATAAGVLGLVDPGFADLILSMLPPETQEDLMNRLQAQQPLPAFQQKTIAQQLKRRLGVPV